VRLALKRLYLDVNDDHRTRKVPALSSSAVAVAAVVFGFSGYGGSWSMSARAVLNRNELVPPLPDGAAMLRYPETIRASQSECEEMFG
jgi:hypothetical protein